MVCVTSGKGGVGKTTTSASLAMGLAERGFRVCAVDFDIGLRNLDLHLGCERRIVFDFVNVIQSECKLHQALIKDRHQPNLFMLAASQTRDKTALTAEGVEQVIEINLDDQEKALMDESISHVKDLVSTVTKMFPDLA